MQGGRHSGSWVGQFPPTVAQIPQTTARKCVRRNGRNESQFDIYDGGKVVGGPAPRPLAMLPLEIVDGIVSVAAEFRGRVGFTQQRLAHQADRDSLARRFDGRPETGAARADHQNIV